jgi:tetratricopeptide (TPR) repeat protein
MKRESLAFAVSGIFFGLLVGWIIGSQYAGSGPLRPPAAAPPSSASAPSSGGTAQPAAVLDEARVRSLTASAEQRPQDAAVRVELGNTYFDAERFTEAIKWYEEAVKVDPRNVNASTDLGVSYYYTNQPDRALAQFEHSLSIDPKHTKTLLNRGIVRAFGKEDLKGAAESWQQVIDIAPGSAEARAAKQALDGMKAAHPDVGAAQAPK